MKFATIRIIAILLALAAIAQLVWLSYLPSNLPTTSVEHRRGYFLFDMLFGAALILQAIPLVLSTDIKSHLTRWAARFLLATGLLCILIGISVAYRHISGVT